MNNNIVVMGGSFNPPTIAHLWLMTHAVNAVNASKGIFVPTAHDYVLRKMKKLHCPQDTLSEAIRLEMLESFCSKDNRFEVNTIKLRQMANKYEFEILESLQAEYPDSKIYFVVGSDKLRIISRWHRINEFLCKFRILVAKRSNDDLNEILAANPYLSEHWASFRVFRVPDEIREVSSSAFRERLRNNDPSAQDLVTPEVWNIMNSYGKIPATSITTFRGEYDFLSNFYEASVMYNGLTFGSNEAAFQAQKCMIDEERLAFTQYRPSQSKGAGRRVQLRADWEEVKTGIMEEIVRAKFTQHEELAARLIATGEKIIIEGNTWGDTFWGIDARIGQGENHLGSILMKIREELRSVSQ